MDTLSSSELGQLSENLKPIIWVLRGKSRVVEFTWTGFCIREDGLLFTCAHCISDVSGLEIRARRLEDEGFIDDVEIVYQRPGWDLTLLKIKGVNGCQFGRFAESGTLAEGESLLYLGHSTKKFIGSCLVGECAYRCGDTVTIPTGVRICSEYNSTALSTTPAYRILGHFSNKDTPDHVDRCEHPLIPVIQCKGFLCTQGCSGGPVFKTGGDIVGMLIQIANGYDIAIHVSLLKEFLRIALQEMEQHHI